MRTLVLGAGFGGLELSTRVAEALGPAHEVVLIDRSEDFVFGFAKLDVMFGGRRAEEVRFRYDRIDRPGLRFVRADIRAIDPVARQVETDAGTFQGDILVVALGADLDPAATPGLVEAGHEFYTIPGAFALRHRLEQFEGGRVLVGVAGTPFKCPPAPSETALLMHDYLVGRGLRDRSTIGLVMPLGSPIPPSPEASAALLAGFAERGIEWYPNRLVTGLDPQRKVVLLGDQGELPFDLFLGVPVHRCPEVVVAAGMTVDGWVPVDPLTLQTGFPDVYAVGDVTSVGTPKAGVFAEGQALVVAEQIVARVGGGSGGPNYDGRGICYLQFGEHMVAQVDVTFLAGQAPIGRMDGPSAELAQSKLDFGTSRVARWFDGAPAA